MPVGSRTIGASHISMPTSPWDTHHSQPTTSIYAQWDLHQCSSARNGLLALLPRSLVPVNSSRDACPWMICCVGQLNMPPSGGVGSSLGHWAGRGETWQLLYKSTGHVAPLPKGLLKQQRGQRGAGNRMVLSFPVFFLCRTGREGPAHSCPSQATGEGNMHLACPPPSPAVAVVALAVACPAIAPTKAKLY